MDSIRIRGARTHNLKNIDLDLPRDRLIVLTGLSGSGKSSLAFDTIYAEGQRRYVESLSAYARQFLSVMEKPDVDHIEGLSPAISIEQKTTSHNPRSTVGTITEIHDYLRLLFARVGEPRCPEHGEPLEAQTVTQMVDQVLALPEGERLMLLAPVVSARKGEYQRLIAELHAQGFVRARIDGAIVRAGRAAGAGPQEASTTSRWWSTASGCAPDLRLRLAESFETALALSGGLARVAPIDRAGEERAPGADLLRQLRLPGLRLQHPGARAAALLLQQPGRGLPELRRAGGGAVLRPRQGGRPPGAEPGRRGHARLGPAQRLLLPDDPRPGEPLRLRPGDPLAGPARSRSAQVVLYGRGKDKLKLKLPPRVTAAASSAPSRASSATWSGATGRPTPTRCARSWPATSPSSPAPPAAAPGSTRRRAMSSSADHNLPAIVGPAGRRGPGLVRGADPARPARRDRRQDPQGDRHRACASWSTWGSTT